MVALANQDSETKQGIGVNVTGNIDGGGVIVDSKGRRIPVNQLNASHIDVEDIAHAQSMLCRYLGRVTAFYSIAEHSVRVAEAVRLRISNQWPRKSKSLTAAELKTVIAALFHDGSEVFKFGDVVRPVKVEYPEIREYERKVNALILQAVIGYEATDEDRALIRWADNGVLKREARKLMPDEGADWGLEEVDEIDVPIECWTPEVAEEKFIELFCSLMNALKFQEREEAEHKQTIEAAHRMADEYVERIFGPLEKVEQKVDREHDPTEVRKAHATGAVRSTCADKYRLDLISPIAISCIADVIGEGQRPFYHTVLDRGGEVTATDMVAEALELIYEALGGDWNGGKLELAAMAVCEAAAAERHDEFGGCVGAQNGLYQLDPRGLLILGETYQEGAVKYGDRNWERGFAVGDLLNHGIRHLLLWLAGDRSESHLGHALWNCFASIHSYHKWPHLNEGNLRVGNCDPPSPPQPNPIATAA